MSLITLIDKHIGNVTWESAELYNFGLNDQIDIWQINVSSNLPQIERFLSVLTPEEINRADKYLRESDRSRFIISRGALRRILSAYLKQPPAGIEFKLTENNKPYIAHPSAPQFHFNLSDSADKVLIAIANSPVGIDVELIKPNFRYHDILNNNFSVPEADHINQHDSNKRFFLLWTRKEAILKATGVGLTDHLKRIPALEGEHLINGDLLSTAANWQLNSFELCESYIVTIASDMQAGPFRYWDFCIEALSR